MFDTKYRIQKYGAMRNLVFDIINEARKKNIVYGLFQMDVTHARMLLNTYKMQTGKSITFTSFILRCFVKAIDQNKMMNAYKKGRRHLMIFDEIDVAVMVEKEIGGQYQPVHYIVRAANDKTLDQISQELKFAKSAPLDQTVSKLDRVFFVKTPRFLRRLFWWLTRKDPKVKKKFSGTVGLTSLGMIGAGTAYPVPMTPSTSTLAIGAIATRPVLKDGQLSNHEFLCCTICVDHDIVDGASVARFLVCMNEFVENGAEIPIFDSAENFLKTF